MSQNKVVESAKTKLEYWGVMMVAGGLIFTGLQWYNANQIADQSVYQRMVVDWSDHLKTFIDKPDVWPYFEEGRPLTPDDPNKNLVLALAEIRLQAMDAVLTNIRLRWRRGFMQWKTTFERAFRQSPSLCFRYAQTWNEWEEELAAIASSTCLVHLPRGGAGGAQNSGAPGANLASDAT